MNNEQRGVVKPTTNQMTHMSHIEHQATSFGIELPSIDLQLGLQSRSIQTHGLIHSPPFDWHSFSSHSIRWYWKPTKTFQHISRHFDHTLIILKPYLSSPWRVFSPPLSLYLQAETPGSGPASAALWQWPNDGGWTAAGPEVGRTTVVWFLWFLDGHGKHM